MGNLKKWILAKAGEERVEAVVIGEMGWGECGSDKVPGYKTFPFGKVISWKKAAKLLDYEFDSGYGSPKCNAVYAWTKSKVIAISQYDGSTRPFSIPRNPEDCMPEMAGG